MEISTILSMPTTNQLVLGFVAIMCGIVWTGSCVNIYKSLKHE